MISQVLIFLIELHQNHLAQLHQTTLYQLSFKILNDYFSCIFCLTLMTQQQRWNLKWAISSSQNWEIWIVTSENELVWGWKYQIFSVLLPFPRKEHIAKGAMNSRIGNFNCIEFFDLFNNLCLNSDKYKQQLRQIHITTLTITTQQSQWVTDKARQWWN